MRLKHTLSIIVLTAFLSATIWPAGARAEEQLVFENDNVRSFSAQTVIIDSVNKGGDVALQFGRSLGEQLKWDATDSQFLLTDDLEVQGALSGSSLSMAGGMTTIAANGTAIFNVNQRPVNFRIATDNQTNMFFVDGTNDRMGIGTGSPDTTLEIVGTASGEHLRFGRLLTGSGTVKIQTLIDSTTAFQVLDADGGNPALSIDTVNERVGVGKASPAATLDVAGAISGSLLRLGNFSTSSGVLAYSSGGVLVPTALGTSGQLLISRGTAAPAWKSAVMSTSLLWYINTVQVTGTGGAIVPLPFDMTVTGVDLWVKGRPQGSAIIVDIKRNGVTIFSTKPQINANTSSGGSAAVFSATALAEQSVLTVSIDQVGSALAGSGLTVLLKGTRGY
jgi:hypothetical protein